MTTGDDVQLVTFKVAGQDLAFNIFQVERILRYEAPVPLPKAPDFLEGVLRYQGAAVPLVDLRKRLSVPAPLREETRTVILEWEGGKLGVIVDAVTEVLHVAAPEITSPPTIVKGLAAEYITGLVVKDGRTIIVLNTARLLTSKEKLPLETAAPEFTGTRPAVHADHIGASTFIEKGWSLISLGDYAGAIQALQKALQLSPGETQAESLLGWAQMLHEDYDDALGTFQKVLMKEPANSLARINVGYICLKKRIFGEAIEHLSKAIRLDNDKKATLYAHFYLGLVYLQREMYEDAQTFFQKTLKLGPNLIEAYYELGRAYWFAGDPAQAKTTWEEGFKANKFNPWGKKCQETLALALQGQEPPRT